MRNVLAPLILIPDPTNLVLLMEMTMLPAEWFLVQALAVVGGAENIETFKHLISISYSGALLILLILVCCNVRCRRSRASRAPQEKQTPRDIPHNPQVGIILLH